MHCIANGMNYFVVDEVAVSAWELHYDSEMKDKVDIFIKNRSFLQAMWSQVEQESPTLYEYLKGRYYDE